LKKKEDGDIEAIWSDNILQWTLHELTLVCTKRVLRSGKIKVKAFNWYNQEPIREYIEGVFW
jgi:hypothetical protein